MKIFSYKHLGITARYFIFWLAAIYFLIFLRFIGHSSTPTNPINADLPLDVTILFRIGLLAAFVIALTFGFLDIVFGSRFFTRMSYGKLILYKSITYTFIFATALVIISIRNLLIIQDYFDFNLWIRSFSLLNMLAWVSYMAVASILLNFTKIVDLKFGPGNLWRMLRGKFHRPHQQEKILMFLDLKSSTTIAERLGHIKYSQLIQDCFDDLSVVRDYNAEVYQYVGDEVILSWDSGIGIRNNNCLKAFYTFRDVLGKRSAYYRKNYDTEPVFKAGMHLGEVTIVEVGRLKREIAFHGDTVNIAARIQGMCNELGKELLISESLANRLGQSSDFEMEELGEIHLRGKKNKIILHSIKLHNKATLAS